jgi:hypothetical protein
MIRPKVGILEKNFHILETAMNHLSAITFHSTWIRYIKIIQVE